MARQVEIMPGVSISGKFAGELEVILANFASTVPEADYIAYSAESLSELHLKEKARRAYRRGQTSKRRRLQYERLSQDPVLRVERSGKLKYREDLKGLYAHGFYDERGDQNPNPLLDQPSAAEIFKMPHLMVNQSPLIIGSNGNPGTIGSLEASVKYWP